MRIPIPTLEAFLRQPAPRTLPPEIQRRALREITLVWLLGAIFLGVGLLSTLALYPARWTEDLRLNRSAEVTEDAIVERRESTSFQENNHRVYRFIFYYTTPDGIRREAVCYRTGAAHDAGATVAVEFLPDAPAIARIRDCRRSTLGPFTLFVVLFPLIGAGLLFFARRARRRVLEVLIQGQFAAGRIESIEATNLRINNETVHRVRVVFRAANGEHTSAYRTRGAGVALARRKQETAATVGVLYLRDDPERIFLVDALAA